MKAMRTVLFGSVLVAFSGIALAASGSPPQTKGVLPVVVDVNAQGKVTDIVPAGHLSPQWNALLRKQLDAWITEPAHDKNGKPMDSRFVVEVKVNTQQRQDGKYDASFAYVKSLPVPISGPVHWEHRTNPQQLVLVGAGSNWMPAMGAAILSQPPVNEWVLQHRAGQTGNAGNTGNTQHSSPPPRTSG